MLGLRFIGALCAALLVPALAQGAEDQPSRFHASGFVQFQFDAAINTPPGDVHFNALANNSEADAGVDIFAGFSLESVAIVEPVRAVAGDQYLSKQGFYAQALYIQYTARDFTLFAGKLHPVFGIAYDLAPGIYGNEFADEYRLVERNGFGFDVNLGHLAKVEHAGEHVLSASLYKADTSFLSDSLFTRRGRTRHADGGISNTGGLSSYSLALDGADLPGLPGLSYHLGLRSQAPGLGDARREKGLVAGVHFAPQSHTATSVELLAEMAHLWHANGQAHHDVTIGTLGLLVDRKGWRYAAVYSGRSSHDGPSIQGTPDSQQVQFTVGHNLPHNFSVDFGWKNTFDGHAKTGTFGLMLSYDFG